MPFFFCNLIFSVCLGQEFVRQIARLDYSKKKMAEVWNSSSEGLQKIIGAVLSYVACADPDPDPAIASTFDPDLCRETCRRSSGRSCSSSR